MSYQPPSWHPDYQPEPRFDQFGQQPQQQHRQHPIEAFVGQVIAVLIIAWLLIWVGRIIKYTALAIVWGADFIYQHARRAYLNWEANRGGR